MAKKAKRKSLPNFKGQETWRGREILKIDKRVPIPGKAYGSKGMSIYPINRMKIGDSIAIPLPSKKDTERIVRRFTNVMIRHRKVGGKFRFTTRVLPKEVRMWRIK